ncbi:hypothetical protein [Actinoplanes rectilineatus]|uniref:hypothetical protein n=1 Tax=Actinoplanes rectilineatus TaxID=113571 RepID=UPI00146FD4B0|nr:hypothetical protein [Actinoplanes rectilineatus]GLY06413.1 hypothetical protein Acsp01_67920 [Actinoplanes sp. NBRC 101535]
MPIQDEWHPKTSASGITAQNVLNGGPVTVADGDPRGPATGQGAGDVRVSAYLIAGTLPPGVMRVNP